MFRFMFISISRSLHLLVLPCKTLFPVHPVGHRVRFYCRPQNPAGLLGNGLNTMTRSGPGFKTLYEHQNLARFKASTFRNKGLQEWGFSIPQLSSRHSFHLLKPSSAMETPALRVRITFEDCSVLNLTQRSVGMSHSWSLIEPHQHPKISDLCDHLLHKFNLHSSCPNGILLFMEGFVLPPSESTRILKDNDIISVKRKELALGEATEGVDACNLLNDEVYGRKPADNGVLLLANEEFDKQTGGYQSEYEEGEVVKSEDEPAPKQTSSKKRKASTKLKTSKKKKQHLEVVSIGDDNNGSEKISKKKSKSNKEIKKVNAETSEENIEDDVGGVEHASSTPDKAKKVGKISYYDGDNIISIPVPEYPIVSDEMDEDGPENSLYKEDGSLEIKFAALADVRSLNQTNSDAVKAISNGVNETDQVVEKNAASSLMSSSNDIKENLPKDPTPVVGNKEVITSWTELVEALRAKKSELMETNEEMKRDTGRNKWSYREP